METKYNFRILSRWVRKWNRNSSGLRRELNNCKSQSNYSWRIHTHSCMPTSEDCSMQTIPRQSRNASRQVSWQEWVKIILQQLLSLRIGWQAPINREIHIVWHCTIKSHTPLMMYKIHRTTCSSITKYAWIISWETRNHLIMSDNRNQFRIQHQQSQGKLLNGLIQGRTLPQVQVRLRLLRDQWQPS